MMQRKTCFVFAMLLMIVVQLTCAGDEKEGSALNRDSYVGGPDKEQSNSPNGQGSKSSSTRSESSNRNTNTFNKLGSKAKKDDSNEKKESTVEEYYNPSTIDGSFVPADFWNFPFPSSNSGASQCFSMVDSLYPEFPDICGPLPQVRYSLPNAFGHTQRWQISQALRTMLSAPSSLGSNTNCPRSIRHLLCPLLFPPCSTPNEPAPVIPCKAFCQAVKSQCSVSSLDLLPCDYLPNTSELCPVTQRPFSAVLTSYGQNADYPGSEFLRQMMRAALTAALPPQQQAGQTQTVNPGSSMPSNIPHQLFYAPMPQATTYNHWPMNHFFPTGGESLPVNVPPTARGLAPQFNGVQKSASIDTQKPIFVNTPYFPLRG